MDAADDRVEAVPVEHLQPGDLVTIDSLIPATVRWPASVYPFGCRVSWVALIDATVRVHDHMGGTWLMRPGSYVLRLAS